MKEKLYIALTVLLLVIAAVLLAVSIFGRVSGNWPLCGALALIILANVMNLFRIRRKRTE